MNISRLAVVLLCLLCLTSCVGKTEDELVELTDENQRTIGIKHAPESLDPSTTSDRITGGILANLSDPLMRPEKQGDGKLEMIPAGAASHQVSEDGLIHTFTIREGHTWQDGKHVTAEDYAYGIKRSLDAETLSPFGVLILPIKNAQSVLNGTLPVENLGVTTEGDNLIIELEFETPNFELMTAMSLMYPQREDQSEEGYPLSSGPYQLETVDETQIVLSKNHHFWNADAVQLERVTLQILEEEGALKKAFMDGSIDLLATADPLDDLHSIEGVSNEAIALPATQFLFFNTDDELLKNEKIRLAMSLAIDREKLLDEVYQGTAATAQGWIPPMVQAEGFIYRDHVEEPLIDLLSMNDPRELFEEGLKELGLDPDPSAITLTLSAGGQGAWFDSLVQSLQENLHDSLGITLEVDLEDWDPFTEQVKEGDYQVGFMEWTTPYDHPSPFFTLLYSRARALNTGWFHEEFDFLVRQTYYDPEDLARFDFSKKAEALLLEQAPVAPLVYPVTYLYRQGAAREIPYDPMDSLLYQGGFSSGH